VPVERSGLGILGVDQHHPQAGEFGYFEGFEEEVLEQSRGKAPTLAVTVNCQPTEEHCGQRIRLVSGRPRSGLCAGHYRGGRRVEGDHPGSVRDNPGPAGTLSLVGWRQSLEPVVERFVAAVESVNIVRPSQKHWPLISVHSESRTESVASNSAIFGLAVNGRSSIA